MHAKIILSLYTYTELTCICQSVSADRLPPAPTHSIKYGLDGIHRTYILFFTHVSVGIFPRSVSTAAPSINLFKLPQSHPETLSFLFLFLPFYFCVTRSFRKKLPMYWLVIFFPSLLFTPICLVPPGY